MDSKVLEEFKAEVYEVLKEAINKSDLFKLLEKYGLEGQEFLYINPILEIDGIKFTEPVKNQELKDTLEAQKVRQVAFKTLGVWCPPGVICD